MQQPSIILLIPYFGQWPVWLEFFLQSCRFNPSIDWLFFTDCPVPSDAPENVRFISMSFTEYKQLVSERLGIPCNPDSPYKLCDLKPALGYVHQEHAEGYDFWGFSDIDLVYGDLRGYFTAERLSKYDLYSTHARRVSGHFCLMRNTAKMRTAFKLMKNWQQRLADPIHHALDEGAFSRIFIRHKNFPKPLFNLMAKLNPWRRNSEFIEAYSTPNAGVPWIDGSFNFPTEWYWQAGKLTNDLTADREYPYFHFLGWKQDVWKTKTACATELLSLPSTQLERWKIAQSGFHALDMTQAYLVWK